jgi:hypothetical protein
MQFLKIIWKKKVVAFFFLNKPNALRPNPTFPTPTFFKNDLHTLIWSSFVKLDKFYLNICRTRSETVRLGSYDRPKWGAMIDQSTSITEKKPEDQKNIFNIFRLILGRFFFSFFQTYQLVKLILNMCPIMGFSVKVVPWQALKLEIGIFCVFLTFEVICRPAPTRIVEIRICGIQIFYFNSIQIVRKNFLDSQEKK